MRVALPFDQILDLSDPTFGDRSLLQYLLNYVHIFIYALDVLQTLHMLIFNYDTISKAQLYKQNTRSSACKFKQKQSRSWGNQQFSYGCSLWFQHYAIQWELLITETYKGLIIIMRNNQLRDRIEDLCQALKGLKAAQIEQQLQLSKNMVQAIIGANEIQKIRSSVLLKLMSYQLIISFDQKTQQNVLPSTRRSNQFSRFSQRSTQASNSVRQVKSLLLNLINKKQPRTGDIKIPYISFEEIMERINLVEQQLSKEENRKKVVAYSDDDQDGSQLIIQQLQLLLKKKQGRIKELNQQLQQNFLDKLQLEQQIEALEHKSIQLEEQVKKAEDENTRLRQQFYQLKQQFQRYKTQQKQDLLFGASQFMNLTLPHKRIQQVTTNLYQENQHSQSDLSQSTKMLYRYCSSTQQKPIQQKPVQQKPIQQKYIKQKTYKKQVNLSNLSQVQQKTAKKPCFMIRNDDFQEAEEQNLLESVRIKRKPVQKSAQGLDNSLQRMLLIQAIFIQQTIQNI